MITLKTKSSDKPQPPRKKGSSSNHHIVKIFVSPRKCECFMVVDSYNRQHHNYFCRGRTEGRHHEWTHMRTKFYLRFPLSGGVYRSQPIQPFGNTFHLKLLTKQLFCSEFFKLILLCHSLSSIDKPFYSFIVLESTCITNSHIAPKDEELKTFAVVSWKS